jgi:class 3 adenylate cyclase/tetratricopeptide (TPR) repeat protein
MALCPNCGEDNPDKAKFCSECATPLKAAPITQAEERKVVSILFVDLVGFTARSHDLDPEDIHAVLAPYHRLLKTEIERFGGTVEKFIGDAVMAVFGAPLAREDDAERSVRAALRITEAIKELNESDPHLDLSIRAAVNTGEGLVNLSARPQSGEGMVTGDVVNTASRLQGVAPVNAVLVGEITYRSTNDLIVYEDMEPVALKGKPEPLAVWRAVSARSRLGVDVETRYRTPFIGRELDLATLKTAYQGALRESSLQLVTVVGEPGVGKSRLLAELASYVDEQEEIVYWRQGRSLPYGEGITFWALGEIVKAQAGINESDSPDVAAEKLVTAVSAVVNDDADQAWVKARLAPLVGATSTAGGAEKEESFTAWLRFFEAIAGRSPLVLVFEDLHWADSTLLEFIEHLVEWSTGVPILVVGTARPELFEKKADWGAGRRNYTTISLSPLSDAETAQLVSALLPQAVLPAEVHAALLERAGGNPLYAEEFIRMLSDRGILVRRGRTLTFDMEADIPIPDNVQAIIAARLDTLPAERKSLLHNAAVVGKVFWSGALATLGDLDEQSTSRSLQELVRQELIRPARTSSVEGHQEYSFWHALIRDVAYGQISRRERRRRHRSAAEWLEHIAGDRASDHAEVLAYHYETALGLTRASSNASEVAELKAAASRFLVMAGERALDLDVRRADSYLERALALLPPDDPPRARALAKRAETATYLGRYDEALVHYDEAIAQFHLQGDMVGAGEAMARSALPLWVQGKTAQAAATETAAVELLETRPPGSALVVAYSYAASAAQNLGHWAEALERSEKALRLAEQLRDQRGTSAALCNRGYVRCEQGDLAGLDDLQDALNIALSQNMGKEASEAYGALSDLLWWIKGPPSAIESNKQGLAFAQRRGLVDDALLIKASNIWVLFDAGDWERLLGDADSVLDEASDRPQLGAMVLPYRALVLALRGATDAAAALEQEFLPLARQIGDLQVLVPALTAAAVVRASVGHRGATQELATEFSDATHDRTGWRARRLPEMLRALFATGQHETAKQLLVDETDVGMTRDRHSAVTAHALVAEAGGHIGRARNLYQEAAQRWADYGFVLEEGQAHLGLARCLIALGDREAATEPLKNARAIFSRLRAIPLIEEADRHLGQATALSS